VYDPGPALTLTACKLPTFTPDLRKVSSMAGCNISECLYSPSTIVSSISDDLLLSATEHILPDVSRCKMKISLDDVIYNQILQSKIEIIFRIVHF
jgi:hypothetical protein